MCGLFVILVIISNKSNGWGLGGIWKDENTTVYYMEDLLEEIVG